MVRRLNKWVRTVIAEPFPVLYGHVNHGALGPGQGPGPFYAAGSEWFDLADAKTLAHREVAANGLRAMGYTVTVDVVER